MSASTPTTGSYLDFAALTRLKGEAAHDPKKALRASAEQFEAYFIQETMKAMRKTVEKSDLMGSTDHTDTYQDLLDKEIAVQMARRGSIGLAKMLESEMARREAGAVPNTQQALALHPANPPLPLHKGTSGLPLSREAQKAYPIDTSQRSKP